MRGGLRKAPDRVGGRAPRHSTGGARTRRRIKMEASRAPVARLDASEVEQRLLHAVPRVHSIQVEDVSDGHTSSAAALASGRSQRAGGLEFKITIVSDIFEELPPLERQRIVYDALRPELESGEIHSLPLMRVWTRQQLADCKQRGEDSRCTALLARSLCDKEREATLQATREAAASADELAATERELRQTENEIMRRSPPSSPSARGGAADPTMIPCECGEATVARPAAGGRAQPARSPSSAGAAGRAEFQTLTEKLQRQVTSDTCACFLLSLNSTCVVLPWCVILPTEFLCGAAAH